MGVFLVRTGFFLLPTAQAQGYPKDNSTSSYFLDNFKCAVDLGSSLPLEPMDNPWRSTLQAGLSFGYYILKYDHTQRGVLRNKDTFNYRHVRIHIGKGLVAMEVGIRYPERNFLKYTDAI